MIDIYHKYFCQSSGVLSVCKAILMNSVHTHQMCYQGYARYLQNSAAALMPNVYDTNKSGYKFC